MPPRGKRGRTLDSAVEVVVSLGEGGVMVVESVVARGGSQEMEFTPSRRGS